MANEIDERLKVYLQVLFRIFKRMKNEEKIQDYSISQTTLDVFVTFAQEDDTDYVKDFTESSL